MSLVDKLTVAPVGSTGNNTHATFQLPNFEVLTMEFIVEAIGATPTVTFKFQGSIDGTNWYDMIYVTDSSDVAATAARTVTTVGNSVQFLASPFSRRYKFVRCVTSANTNVTYRAEVRTVEE